MNIYDMLYMIKVLHVISYSGFFYYELIVLYGFTITTCHYSVFKVSMIKLIFQITSLHTLLKKNSKIVQHFVNVSPKPYINLKHKHSYGNP